MRDMKQYLSVVIVFAVNQATGDPPEVVDAAFAADVCRPERQCILVVQGYATSLTISR